MSSGSVSSAPPAKRQASSGSGESSDGDMPKAITAFYKAMKSASRAKYDDRESQFKLALRKLEVRCKHASLKTALEEAISAKATGLGKSLNTLRHSPPWALSPPLQIGLVQSQRHLLSTEKTVKKLCKAFLGVFSQCSPLPAHLTK